MGDVSGIQQAKKWIYDSLIANADIAADLGTRTYADAAPSPRPSRYILYNTQAASHRNAVGHAREATSALFQIRTVTTGAPTAADRKIAKRIEDIFQAANNQSSGDYRFSSICEDEIDRPEYDSTNQRYHNLGQMVRVWITPV